MPIFRAFVKVLWHHSDTVLLYKILCLCGFSVGTVIRSGIIGGYKRDCEVDEILYIAIPFVIK